MQNYRLQFAAFQKAKQALAQMQQQQKLADETADYNRFLLEEFEELNLQPGELEILEEELKLLSNAETVKVQLSAVAFELSESEQPIVQQFRSLVHKLQQVEKYYPQVSQLIARLQSVQIEAQDIAGEISDAEAHIQYDAERIQQLNERMEKGYRLLKKHHVQTTAELCAIQQVLQEKMNNLQNIGLQIEAQTKLVADLEKGCRNIAQEIATNRNKAAIPFSEKINELLLQVGMPNARIQVSITPTLQLTEQGIDQVALLFDANKTNRFEPISKVASGGELSRLMLCIKSLVARKLQLPTLIFDEIDTGISGEAAKQVGIIMKRMSAHHQIFAITHQPQIAAKAKAHYFVYKQIEGENIHTAIRLLGNEERITIIAQMLSGAQPTAAAMQNAKEMVEN
jgi:DNA repair protein RecN (Recombination protein N)